MEKEIIKKLQDFQQEHLLYFYDELDEKDKNILLNEIKNIDIDFMKNLYIDLNRQETIDINNISALNCITSITPKEKEEYINIGEEIVSKNEYAVLLMAGGNASRLGLGIPKGCLEINVNNKKISLFELYIDQLKKFNNKYDIIINLYIMTSKTNELYIKEYFEKNNYFGYSKENIKFFSQSELPILDTEGNLLLKDKCHILFGPNGNGNVFASLKINGLIDDLIKKNIKYVLFSTIDNVLVKLVDLEFIGATIKNNYKLATKTITKKDGSERDWVFCKYNDKPYMLPTRYINEEITNAKNDQGEYIYREKNVTYHMISVDLIAKFADVKLKYHRAHKKNNCINKDGQFINAESPNTYKFEQFIFDAFYSADDMLLYRIDEEKEFCPIKNFDDIKKAEDKLSD